MQLLHCWLWPSLAFWTLTPEHAARQSFPLYPAIAGLAAMVWLAWITGRLAWPFRTRPAYVLAACVVGWCAVKFAFVHVVVPDRTGRGAPWLHAWLPDGGRKREPPREKGAAIARLVPEGRTLYVFRLKDEGIMFYYGRPVRRLAGPAQLPSTGEPLYCMLDGPEWDEQQRVRPAEALLRINDSQGAPIVLVRTRR